MLPLNFATAFRELTRNGGKPGNDPFPWQQALYDRFMEKRPDNIPAACNLPTGLGKTSVIAVWLIALANGAKVPRRLVYVVNRRTVVDQTTDEVTRYRDNLAAAGITQSLALSTLRGQFADNREWSADPSRPAVICGTVDMIGSRLLFSGYGVGMKGKPLHAGFLGQDALIVHDEAHLEPAFQELLLAIECEQKRCKDFNPLRVMELTATSRGTTMPFGLTDEDRKNTTVHERVSAKKTVYLVPEEKKLAEQLAAKAMDFKDRNRAVLVFARTVDDVMKIRDRLPKGRVETLTGTMRGKERDGLVEKGSFKRFMPGGQSDDETTYLVCTSAGEVGVNISADHLVCDLSTFDSMAQRFGRVNRFGKRTDSEIHVVHSTAFEDDDYAQRRAKTLALLGELNGDGSPDALGNLDAVRRREAFAPTPTLLPATDILFDAWALTTIRGKLPGRPPVEPYLHGMAEWQPPETQVAWREEVETVTGDMLAEYKPADLLEAYPLRPHELLKEPSHRAFRHFEAMSKRRPTTPAWLVDDDGKTEVVTVADLADKDYKNRINGMTVLLPPSAGGLSGGMLDGTAPPPTEGSLDVADTAERVRVWGDDAELEKKTEGMHSVLTIAFPGEDDGTEGKTWEWFTLRTEGDKSAKRPVLWEVHVGDVEREAKALLSNLALPDHLRATVEEAAALHDHGKKRRVFQAVLGNRQYPHRWLAKSGKRGGRLKEQYRHEFGSLLDVEQEVTGEHRDLILHLIAAHHGRARPHFDPEEAFDPERPHADAARMAAEVPRRFARLQRKYGRWGLAYLESLLRAADWAASANPSKFVEEGQE